MNDFLGQSLGRYHILEKLGEGGMATVYKAFDTRLERDVAVKIIRKEAFSQEVIGRILKRFEREAKTLARLIHPNIVSIIDYGEYENSPYLVMPFLSGGTLKQKMGKTMPWQDAARLLLPIARALAYVHDQDVIHRDVKPANILITTSGEPMLTDFGIAKMLDLEAGQTLTGTGVGIGTPEYMAPEQGMGKEIDGRADIYSLGIILYELVTGRKPFTADTPMAVVLKHMTDPLPRPGSLVDGLPDAVEKVIIKALAKAPADRYQNMSEFAGALKKLESTQVDEKPGVEPPTAAVHQDIGQTDTYATVDQLESPGKIPRPVLKKLEYPGLKIVQPQPVHEEKKPLPVGKVLGFGLGGIALLVLVIGIYIGWFKEKPDIGSRMISEIDGMTLVYVPEGEFSMGSPEGVGEYAEQPQHQVYLDAYWIDQTEVTSAMFSTFVNETGYKTDAEKDGESYVYLQIYEVWESMKGADWQHPYGQYSSIANLENHPVIHVSWNDAYAYCIWAGRQLPSEAQWEKAARGTDGRTYPWGNQVPAGNLLNFADTNTNFDWSDSSADDGYADTAPVGSYPDGASPYGALDMAGNVWEWVADWFGVYPTESVDYPTGPSSGIYRVLRGGSWIGNTYSIRSAKRSNNYPTNSSGYVGFRCALPVQ